MGERPLQKQLQVCLYDREHVQCMQLQDREQNSCWLYSEEDTKRTPLLELHRSIHGWNWKGSKACHGSCGEMEGSLHNGLMYHFYGEKSWRLLLEELPITPNYLIYQLQPEMTILIGRDPQCHICFSQPYVSWRHAKLQMVKGVWQIEDIGGHNGMYLNQQRVHSHSLQCGDHLHVMGLQILFGDQFLLVAPRDALQIHKLSLFQNKEIDVKQERQPQELQKHLPSGHSSTETTLHLEAPALPKETATPPLWFQLGPSFTMGLSSVFMGVSTWMQAVMLKQSIWQSLPSLVMAFTMALSSLCWPLVSHRYEAHQRMKQRRRYVESYQAYIAKKQEELQVLLQQAQDRLNKQDCSWVYGKDLFDAIGNIWQRDPSTEDFLKLHFGIARQCCHLPLEGQRRELSYEQDVLYAQYQKLLDHETSWITAPFSYDLKKTRCLGLFGCESQRYLMSLLLQITATHDPREVKLVLIMDIKTTREWQLRFLPHLFSAHQETRYLYRDIQDLPVLYRVLEEAKQQNHETAFLMVITQPQVLHQLAFDQLFATYPFLCVLLQAEEYDGLPCLCQDILEIQRTGNAWLHQGEERMNIQVTAITKSRLQQNLKQLSLFRWKTEESVALRLTFLDLYACGNVSQLDLLKRWSTPKQEQTLAVPIGVDEHGAILYLDAHETQHGPHGLIAGMTGSGKSELLLTYLLSLCVNYSCEEVSLVLIDYKGGMMASALEQLPHVVGILTNLEEGQMYRFAAALDSELKRRQYLLKTAKTTLNIAALDMDGYQQLYRQQRVTKALPHLFIVADEFAELKVQQPDFMEKLKQLARIGRSLGVHLILATQKPYGIIDDQIWSNARFHICLKVQDRNDSLDMLKREDACRLQEAGAFYLQVGNDELFIRGHSSFTQAKYHAHDRYEPEYSKDVCLYDDQLEVLASHTWEPEHELGTTQLTAICQHILAQAANCEYERYTFMQPLPQAGTVQKKLSESKYPSIAFLDDITLCRQSELQLSIHSMQHALLAGKPGSGKLMFLTRLLLECARCYREEELLVYLLDGSHDGLEVFQRLDIVSDVVDSAQLEALESLKYQLLHRSSKIPVLFILHGYEACRESWHGVEELLQQLLTKTEVLQVHVVVTVQSTTSIPCQMMNWFDEIFLLQLQERFEYQLLSSDTLRPLTQKGSGICQREGRVMLFQVIPYDLDIEQQLYRAQKGTARAPIPVLDDLVLPKYREDAWFLGQDLIRKKECWLPLERSHIVLICSAFRVDESWIQYLKTWRQQYPQAASGVELRNTQETPIPPALEANRCHVLFVTLRILSQLTMEAWYLEALYEGDILWVGRGLEEAAHLLKLPMECLQQKPSDQDMLWYREGDWQWIRKREVEING